VKNVWYAAGGGWTARTLMRAGAVVLGVLLVAAVAATAFVGGFWYAHHRASQATLPVLAVAPTYALKNQLGQTVASSAFLGKVQLVTFLSPYCTSYCPLIALNLLSLEKALEAADLAERVQFVAFNVDPENTGSPQMTAFLRQFGWNPEDTRWQFLTGPSDEVRKVVSKGFFIDYERVSEAQQEAAAEAERQRGTFVPEPEVANPLAVQAKPDYDILHNDALVVVDPQGRIRQVYDEASRVPNADLLATINRLVAGG
jgi:protein SCO1/2